MLDVKACIERIADRVCAIIQSNPSATGPLSLYPVSHRGGRMILRADAGNSSFCVKVFDSLDHDAGQKFNREVAALQALKGHGLAPEIVGQDAQDRFVIMTWIDGPTLKAHFYEGLSREAGIAVGAWFGKYATAMSRKATDGSWYDYLSNYGEFGSGDALRGIRDKLETMPLGEVGIAKNDGYLDNFLVTSGQRIVGIDFAEARLKPLGWDILLTARSLRREFGEAATPVIDGLVQGWCEADPLRDLAVFDQLTWLFLRALK